MYDQEHTPAGILTRLHRSRAVHVRSGTFSLGPHALEGRQELVRGLEVKVLDVAIRAPERAAKRHGLPARGGHFLAAREPRGLFRAELPARAAGVGRPRRVHVLVAEVRPLRTIVETTKRDGKIVSITSLTVSADGKTLTAKSEDKERGTTSTWVATKQ